MPDSEKLTPADPEDLAASLAFALRFEGRKRKHDADTFNPFPLREQTMPRPPNEPGSGGR